ncbi:hypothetical protein WJX72_008481 [[Myrmecia] bisecta]|uniref:Seipin n=1 Tax=[Myrmecia] bisecta TaxID=41462 RepID=A0AAW1P6H9_9CHLO
MSVAFDSYQQSTGNPLQSAPSRSSSPQQTLLRAPALLQWLGLARGLLLLVASGLCAAVAVVGLAVLVFIVLSRSAAPAATLVSRSLYFDFTLPHAEATAFLLPDEAYVASKSVAGAARFLKPGQHFDVWVELVVPDSFDEERTEVFQVKAELLSADGRLAVSASRPGLVKYRSPVIRQLRALLLAPLVLMGLAEEQQDLQLPLLTNYAEKPDIPFAVFRATLHARAGGGRLPQLYDARVHVRLRLGLLRRLLYMVRPGNMLMLLLMSVALAFVGAGGSACIVLLMLWLYTVRSPGRMQPGTSTAPASDDELLSSEPGLSDVDSALLADSEAGSEEAGRDSLETCIEPWADTLLSSWDPVSSIRDTSVCSEPYHDSLQDHLTSKPLSGSQMQRRRPMPRLPTTSLS